MFHFKFKENYSIIVVFDIGAKVGVYTPTMFYHTLGIFKKISIIYIPQWILDENGHTNLSKVRDN